MAGSSVRLLNSVVIYWLIPLSLELFFPFLLPYINKYIQIKTTMRYHFKPIKMAIIKKIYKQ